VHYPGTYAAGCFDRLTDEVEGMVVENEHHQSADGSTCGSRSRTAGGSTWPSSGPGTPPAAGHGARRAHPHHPVRRGWARLRRRSPGSPSVGCGGGRPPLQPPRHELPGPPQPLWLAGAQLRDAVPVAPLAADVPLGVAALSYAGALAAAVRRCCGLRPGRAGRGVGSHRRATVEGGSIRGAVVIGSRRSRSRSRSLGGRHAGRLDQTLHPGGPGPPGRMSFVARRGVEDLRSGAVLRLSLRPCAFRLRRRACRWRG
jgi:hypothetical protein